MKTYRMLFVIALAATVGCNQSEVAQSPEPATTPSTDSEYLTTVEPSGALPVGQARQTVQNDQQVTLVGIIGGSTTPFIDGLAAFTIVDERVPYCAPEEGCPTPWDYCCTRDQVKENIATVKIVDQSGKPVAQSASELLGYGARALNDMAGSQVTPRRTHDAEHIHAPMRVELSVFDRDDGVNEVVGNLFERNQYAVLLVEFADERAVRRKYSCL